MQCSPNSVECICIPSTTGPGVCVDGSTNCNDLAACGVDADCGALEICAQGCCERRVCVRVGVCGDRASPGMVFGRKGEGATVGRRY